MSNSKNYNSIVFLTTLSVYLGLVLIGGTPPVLAHAAMTQQLDIQNEIEINDDLDKKPDNEDFPALFVQFLNDIKESGKRGKIALPIQTNFSFEANFFYGEMDSGAGFGIDPSADKYLAEIVSNSFNQKFEPKAYKLADYPRFSAKNIKLNLQATDADLSLKITFGKYKAEQFAEFLNKEFSVSSISVKKALLKQVYENAKVTSENNQIFIVIRLPRGSLDAFLANKDAQ